MQYIIFPDTIISLINNITGLIRIHDLKNYINTVLHHIKIIELNSTLI